MDFCFIKPYKTEVDECAGQNFNIMKNEQRNIDKHLFLTDAGVLMDSVTSPITQRICLISMYELLSCPMMWLCRFLVTCHCISEQRRDLCKCHFSFLRAKS